MKNTIITASTRKIMKTMLALLGTSVLLMAFQCSKDEVEPAVNTHNVSNTGCLSHAGPKGHINPDSVSVAYSDGILHVTHHNLTVNCGVASRNDCITVTCTRTGSTIDIYEEEVPSVAQANCVCEVDNEFDLSGLTPGTYTLVFHNWYPEAHAVTVSF